MATRASKIHWSQEAKWSDGSTLVGADFRGYTLYIDGKPGVSVPRAWETDGDYEMDLAAMPDLITFGQHSIQLTTSAINSQGVIVESDKTAAATYTLVDDRKPKSPFGLSVA